MARIRRLLPRFSLRTLVVFTLLVTSATGLWWHWEPWCPVHTINTNSQPDRIGFLDGGVFLLAETSVALLAPFEDPEDAKIISIDVTRSTWDVRSGRLIEEHTSTIAPGEAKRHSTSFDTPDRARRVSFLFSHTGVPDLSGTVPTFEDVHIIDSSTEEPLALLGKVPGPCRTSFSPSGDVLAVAGMDHSIQIWQRRRPEWWWGVFWLWEFWLTVAFTGLFVWSVWQDRRALGREE